MVYSDNQSAIHLARNQNYFHGRTKHIALKYHYIQDTVASGKVVLGNVHISENPTDMLTKSLSATKFEHCSNSIGCY